jgi:cytochrome c peroxidase
MRKTLPTVFVALIGAAVLSLAASAAASAKLTSKEELGKKIFFDKELSTPAGQDCAACHHPSVGWTGPDEASNKSGGVYEGAVRGRFGNRKPPAASYAGASPVFRLTPDGTFVGGMFWDGRASGETLGDPLAEQAMGPFLNPLEQNMPDTPSIILKIKAASYAGLFESVWGSGSLDERDPQKTYVRIARSIAAYERSAEVNPFSSKFDDFWRAAKAKGLQVEKISQADSRFYAGLGLDNGELKGLVLFAGKGRCAACHVLTPERGGPPVFTDYTYDNLGIPRNTANPFYAMPKEFNPEGKAWVDKGLGSYLETIPKYKPYAAANMGKHKVPTLRNVAKMPRPGFAKAYMHNGCFKSLKDIVRFYNTRDVAGAGWPEPEAKANINTKEMGRLGLTGAEEDLIVLFMKTLTDR